MIKIKVAFPRAYPLGPLVSLFKRLKRFGFPIFRLWAYLQKFITETRQAHQAKFDKVVCFHKCLWLSIYLIIGRNCLPFVSTRLKRDWILNLVSNQIIILTNVHQEGRSRHIKRVQLHHFLLRACTKPGKCERSCIFLIWRPIYRQPVYVGIYIYL
jgi:hypothetical protein